MGNIYLVGFMGTGKTVVGKELAARMKRDFIDLDEVIEKKEKRSIAEIFEKEAEPYFRRVEKKTLAEFSRKDNLIISCGGGIVKDEENIKRMKETGKIICLSAKPEIILKRTKGYKHRPLLNVAEPQKKIESLLSARGPFYARSDKTIDTSTLSVKEVVDRIREFLCLSQC